jgi:hypothetical protein
MEPTRFAEMTRRFIFNGKASALGGQIFLPEKAIVDVTCGASALGSSGGISRSATEGRRFGEFISFASAETRAEGLFTNEKLAAQVVGHRRYQDEQPTATTLSATLRGLQVSQDPVFTAEHISAELITRTPDPKSGDLRFVTGSETAIRGVAITDRQGKQYGLEVTLNTAFQKKYDTKTRLLETADDAVFPRTYVGHETPRGQGASKNTKSKTFAKPPKGSRINSSRGAIYSTIVKSIKWTGEPYPGSEINENIVQIPNLGLIFFGELIVESSARRLTMVRFELGSFEGGYADGVDLAGNGGYFP